MKTLEQNVIRNYENGTLMMRILSALSVSGIDTENLKPDDLAPVEEFHIGGRAATKYLVDKLKLGAEDHVLDIGCGIGGAARYLASQNGNKVTGIDLTPDFIAVAKDLSERVDLDEMLSFETGSALAMPFSDSAFDAAISLHVAMNIQDRETLYKEAARVLKSGASLGLYDVMRKDDGELVFPVPWSETADTSYLMTPEETSNLLQTVGFTVNEIEDRYDVAIEFFKQSAALPNQKPASSNIQPLLGETAPQKFKNVLNNIEQGLISPVQIIATRN